MLSIRGSHNAKSNPQLRFVPRTNGNGNLSWLAQHLPKKDDGRLRLLLLGGTEPLHFRLRVAQSHFRHDMSPSHFSHVALMAFDRLGRVKLWECALDPKDGFGYPPEDNAFRFGALKDYDDARRFPNICLLSSEAKHADVLSAERVRTFRHQRAALDVVALLHAWLGYAWGVGDAPNPLQRDEGIPSAAAAEVLLANSGIDLTPGVSSRSSCPEAIWQAAKWWQLPKDADEDLRRQSLAGVFCVDHSLGVRLPPIKKVSR